ncbi:MAG: saccharopine dehydrogenase NADP-binding domain-containing protein [bacterium]|nr:saccharopine dehydrogenase NADP-binding domain-containing protein [bacterium]
MRVLIMGGGATGSVIAHFLSEAREVDAILVGDINTRKAKRFLPNHPKISLQQVDATQKDKVALLAKGFDLLINASLSQFNKILLDAALEAGVNYQDLASKWDNAKVEQLDFHEKFKAKNLVGLINSSASPGMTNLVAKLLSLKFDRVDSIKVRLLENVSSDTPFTAWSKEVAFDEVTQTPYVWDKNHFVAKDNFGEEELFSFPEPFTNRKCYLVSQEEVGTLPAYIKTKYVDLKIGGTEIEFVYTLFKLGLLKNKLVRIGNALVSAYELIIKVWPDVPSPQEMKKLAASPKFRDAHFWASVIVSGIGEKNQPKAGQPRAGKKILRGDILFPPQAEVNRLLAGSNYISYAAGASAAIFALETPKLKEKGVYPPEALEKEAAEAVAERLKKFGVKLDISEAA